MSGFFFAWANSTDTTFTDHFKTVSEQVFSFTLSHTEGNFPTLEVEIQNPRRGLLNGQVWAWFAHDNGHTVTPLFFGRLVGLPNNLDKETITLQLMARSSRWLLYKQATAEALKVSPGYDPIFLDATKRDDPDAIMEGYSAAFHYDRLPSGSPADLQISTSDILIPEDGFVTFQEKDIFYESVNLSLGQQPLVTVQIKSQVHWTQRASGTIDMGARTFDGIWTGGSLIDSWPKAGQQLAGGYTVAAATAFNGGAQFGSPQPHQIHFENRSSSHEEGDVMSINGSWTTYPCGGQLWRYGVVNQPGFVDPSGSTSLTGFGTETTDDGSPTGVNIPLHIAYNELLVCSWTVFTTLVLDYEAARPRSERLEFKLNALVQNILTDADEPASLDTETVNIPGTDVGLPIQFVLSWFTLFLRGRAELGQVVQSTVEFLGGPIYAICVTIGGGAVGTTEPDWSDVIGDLVTDGAVTWAIIGSDVPADFHPWREVAGSEVAAGTVIRAQTYLSPPRTQLGIIASPAPAAGVHSFQVALNSGVTQQYSNALFTGFADLHPDHPEPFFSQTAGQTTVDGSVTWASLGAGGSVMELPMGLNTAARTFFPKDRGIRAAEYLLSVARAKLLFRARVAKMVFETKFENAMNLTLRMGAIVYDNRLPGGTMSGKITAYTMKMVGDTSVLVASVQIEGSVGDESLHFTGAVAGYPTYADIYDDGTYQFYTGQTNAVGHYGDVGFTPPIDAPNDDGVNFPATKADIVVKEGVVTGLPPGAPQFLPNSTYQLINTWRYANGSTVTVETLVQIPNGYTPVQIPVDIPATRTTQQQTITELAFYPITQYYAELKNLQRSFSDQFKIDTTDLSVPQMIDLNAASSP